MEENREKQMITLNDFQKDSPGNFSGLDLSDCIDWYVATKGKPATQ